MQRIVGSVILMISISYQIITCLGNLCFNRLCQSYILSNSYFLVDHQLIKKICVLWDSVIALAKKSSTKMSGFNGWIPDILSSIWYHLTRIVTHPFFTLWCIKNLDSVMNAAIEWLSFVSSVRCDCQGVNVVFPKEIHLQII